MKNKQKTAIFDIDGTLFRSSLLIEIVNSLIENKIFAEKTKKGFESEKKKWLERKGPYEDYINAVIKTFTVNIKGVSYLDFMELSRKTVRKQQWQTYIYTRFLIKTLKKNGYYLLAISQSPKGVLDEFCANFGFDKVYGRIYDLGPEDRFTGKIDAVHLIANKANIVRRAVEKENLTLKESFGVGDTESDIPFLEMVSYPICFNPNKNLYRHAILNKWNIVVERKDVVYKIRKSETYPRILNNEKF
jgi:HAD superfamily hydrolase (TIGR01490 family)